MSSIVENVVYQHVENVCALWRQRHDAVNEPHYSLGDLVYLDNRVDANLDGVRIAGESGLEMVDELFNATDDGACFCKALLFIENGEQKAFFELVEQVKDNPIYFAELDSALAWSSAEKLQGMVKSLLDDGSPSALMLGLSCCASHNRNPGKYLEKGLSHKDSAVRSKALHVTADVGDSENGRHILSLRTVEADQEKYEAGRALAFCGQQKAAREWLSPIALSSSNYASQACDLVVQLDDKKLGKALLKKLDAMDGRVRDVIRGFGLMGDPVAMDWLIKNCEVPALARLCGGSITMITGIDLAAEDLETPDSPEGFEDPGPNDNPEDEHIDLDDDENLPWPNPELVSEWWQLAEKLPTGSCFLDGREKKNDELRFVLKHGLQRQRNAAAVAVAIANPDAKYMDTRLPTSKQRAWLN